MLNNSYAENVKHGFLQEWDNVAKCKKPIIAAVNGYAVSRNFVPAVFNHQSSYGINKTKITQIRAFQSKIRYLL